MDALSDWFSRRYPLLADIAIGTTADSSVPTPPLVGLMTAVAESERASYCFVLPRKGDLGRIASVAIAITSLKRDYSALAAASEAPVKPGEYVRVHPGKRVYRFCGDSRDYPEHFWLECKDGSRRTFPRSQAFRLERTLGPRLTGSGSQPLISVPKHSIDLLLGLESYGNLSNIPNAVLLLDVQSRFREFAHQTFLARSSGAQSSSVKILDLGVIGQVEEDGSLVGLNGEGGFPVLAISSSIESIVNAIGDGAKTSTVIVNSLALLKSPQHFDSLADKARVIAFAEHNEYRLVNELRARGCRVWPIGSSEILSGCSSGAGAPSNGPFEAIVGAARNSSVELVQIEAVNDLLEGATAELQRLGLALSNAEDQRRQLVGPIFGLLLRMASAVGEASEIEHSECSATVKDVRAELDRLRHWIAADDVKCVAKACECLELALANDARLGVTKLDKLAPLLEMLKHEAIERVVVVGRKGTTADHISRLAESVGIEVELFTGDPALTPDGFFAALVVTSWIGSGKFKRLFHAYLAPRVYVLGYPFELRWLAQCLSSIRRDASGVEMSGEERARVIRLDAGGLMQWTGTKPSERPAALDGDAALLNIERSFSGMRRGSGVLQSDGDEKIPARYVEFAGGRFAFLSEGHALPVATRLVLNESRASAKLPEREVSEWLAGDYIVFLEGGGAPVIKSIADRMLGARAIRLRQTAMVWRNALVSCGLSASEIQRRLREERCVRTMTTVRGWLSSSSRIGPEQKADLEAIAKVTGVRALATSIDVVWAAIQELWSAHLSAGSVLRRILVQKLPHLVDQLEEAGTELSIDDGGKHLGRALIVRVEQIADAFEPCSRSLVNRLRVAESQILAEL